MANWFKKALPYAAGALTGGVMSSFAPTAKFAAAGSAAAGALTNKKNPLAGALQGGVGGGVGAAGAGALKGFTSGTGTGDQAWNAFKGYGSSIPGMGGIGTSAPTGALAKFLTPQSIQNSGQKLVQSGPARTSQGVQVPSTMTPMSAFKNTTTGATGTPSSSTPSGFNPKKIISSIMGGGDQQGINWPGMGIGAGVSMAGSLFAPKVAASDFSGVTGPLKDRINNPSADYRQAMDVYRQQTSPENMDIEPALANIKLRNDREFAEAVQNLDQQFRANMGGAGNFMNSSAYQDAYAKLKSQYDQNYTSQVAETQMKYDMAKRDQQMAAANALAGMDQTQVQALANLAQYDIYSIAEQTGYDLQSAQQIKDLAATAGQIIMQNAAGVNKVGAA
jgi:hypothetical protein